VKYLLFF